LQPAGCATKFSQVYNLIRRNEIIFRWLQFAYWTGAMPGSLKACPSDQEYEEILMAKQSDKTRLLTDIKTEHQRLENYLELLIEADMLRTGVVGDWSVKDLLAHLTAWEQLFLSWYQAGLTNTTVRPSPVGMGRTAIDEINQSVYAENKSKPLAQVLEEFHASYRQTLALVESIPEDDIFGQQRFAWTGKHTLADYVTGNTSNHYRWAKDKVRQWLLNSASADDEQAS
jgi:hypothetical protein